MLGATAPGGRAESGNGAGAGAQTASRVASAVGHDDERRDATIAAAPPAGQPRAPRRPPPGPAQPAPELGEDRVGIARAAAHAGASAAGPPRPEPVERARERPQAARHARPRRLLADPEPPRHLCVVELLDDPQAHRVALLVGELGERSGDGRAQLAQRRELLDADELLAVEHRRLHAGAAQRAPLGSAAAQRLVEDVARDPEDPRRQRVVIVRVADEAAAQLERAGIRLADEIDRELRVVRAAREEHEQPPRVALIGRGEAVGVQSARAGHHVILSRAASL